MLVVKILLLYNNLTCVQLHTTFQKYCVLNFCSLWRLQRSFSKKFCITVNTFVLLLLQFLDITGLSYQHLNNLECPTTITHISRTGLAQWTSNNNRAQTGHLITWSYTYDMTAGNAQIELDKYLKAGTDFIRQADLMFTHHSPSKHLFGTFYNLHVTDVEEKVLYGKMWHYLWDKAEQLYLKAIMQKWVWPQEVGVV